MIDPTDVIKFDRTTAELQEWWLFSCAVAGKTAATQARLLDNFVNSLPMPRHTPFGRIATAEAQGTLRQALIDSRLGQYNRLHRCYVESLNLNLVTCTVADLEAIHGVGPKTARMFIMHSRPDQRLAALDTHVLKYLRENGHPDAPMVTPGSARAYAKFEQAFLDLSDKSGMTVSEFDLAVWKMYARRTEGVAA